VYLTCSKKLTGSQLSLPHGINTKLKMQNHSTIATSIVYSKLDYCNFLYHNLPNCQLNRLQQLQNSVARSVVNALKSTSLQFSNLSTGLRSTKALDINFSLTFKVLTTSQPIHNLISLQPPCNTRSSSVVILSRPPTIIKNHRSLI